MIKIAIRIDDITENMDWQKFLRFKGLLDRYGIKPLIGVVPDNQDDMLNISKDGAPEDFWAYIKELQEDGFTIAMHGVNHIYTTKKGGNFPLNHFSEFAGLPYEEQLELLSYGVDIFNQHDIATDIFMAPGHSFDDNTLKALKLLGFTKITDGFGKNPYNYKGFTFYPISFKKSSTLKADNGYSTLVFHLNGMKDSEFDSFERLLNKQKNYKFISYNELLSVASVNRGFAGSIYEHLRANVKHILVKMIGLS